MAWDAAPLSLEPQFMDLGTGPTILFLHGFNGGAELWAPTLEDVAAMGFRCLAPDFPGWGDTRPIPNFSYHMADLVTWLTAFLDRHTSGPLIVVGHSFGGAVGLHLALKHPERVSGLVLANAAGLSASAAWHYRALCIPGLGEWLLKPDLSKVRQTVKEFLVCDIASVPSETLAYLDRVVFHPWFISTSLQWVRRNHVLWRGSRAISALPKVHTIQQPTLLLVSEEDVIIDPQDGIRAVTRFPNARLVTFPGARHWISLDRRAQFSQAVIDFAQQITGEPGQIASL